MYFVGGEGFIGKVLGIGVEVFFDEVGVEMYKVLYLFFFDDFGYVCLFGVVELWKVYGECGVWSVERVREERGEKESVYVICGVI